MRNEYPSDWNRRRKRVYRRDDYTCQNCGRRGGPYGNAELHAHHIVPKGNGGTHRLSNLKTVCKDCHAAIHGRKIAPTVNRHNKVSRKSQTTDRQSGASKGSSSKYEDLAFRMILPGIISAMVIIGSIVIGEATMFLGGIVFFFLFMGHAMHESRKWDL